MLARAALLLVLSLLAQLSAAQEQSNGSARRRHLLLALSPPPPNGPTGAPSSPGTTTATPNTTTATPNTTASTPNTTTSIPNVTNSVPNITIPNVAVPPLPAVTTPNTSLPPISAAALPSTTTPMEVARVLQYQLLHLGQVFLCQAQPAQLPHQVQHQAQPLHKRLRYPGKPAAPSPAPSSPAPSPPAPPFVGTTQVFIVLTNVSAEPAGRRLLQATDLIKFGILLVPIPLGTAFYSLPPANASAVDFYGIAPGGNVTIYANGQILAVIPCSGGTGSLTLAVPRTNQFYTSSFESSTPAFPSTPSTGPGSATVVDSSGALQASSANVPPTPPPPGKFITSRSPPPGSFGNATTSSASQSSHAAAIAVPTVVGFVIIVITIIAIIYFVRRWRKNKNHQQAGSPAMQPLSAGPPRLVNFTHGLPERFTERHSGD
ncbi:hypothetical protein WJX73_006974 [Symbiochloris irregularis]|uniref:Uncharacterized protein n=1 Tax=Symbiochloris irregularis TaxID=706552 RepID=A0AAW1NQR1_9CHLO